MQITKALAVCFRRAKLAFPQADMGSHIKVFLPSRASLVQSYCETFSMSGVCVCVTAIACVCRVSSLSMSGVCVCVCHSTCVQSQFSQLVRGVCVSAIARVCRVSMSGVCLSVCLSAVAHVRRVSSLLPDVGPKD